jgi:DNA-binding MarR family transcriptional regulator
MTPALDPVIHPPHRLRACAMLFVGGPVELSVVKEGLGISKSALSKQIAALAEAGYVTQSRSPSDSRRIWLDLTREGRAAYAGHVAALQAIVTPSASSGAVREAG